MDGERGIACSRSSDVRSERLERSAHGINFSGVLLSRESSLGAGLGKRRRNSVV
jgi:hypothetical protein